MSSLFSVALSLCETSSKKEFLCIFPLAIASHREQHSKPAAQPLNAESTWRQDAESPDECRRHIRNLEIFLRHTADTGNQWHNGTKRAKEAANESPGHAPF